MKPPRIKHIGQVHKSEPKTLFKIRKIRKKSLRPSIKNRKTNFLLEARAYSL